MGVKVMSWENRCLTDWDTAATSGISSYCNSCSLLLVFCFLFFCLFFGKFSVQMKQSELANSDSIHRWAGRLVVKSGLTLSSSFISAVSHTNVNVDNTSVYIFHNWTPLSPRRISYSFEKEQLQSNCEWANKCEGRRCSRSVINVHQN